VLPSVATGLLARPVLGPLPGVGPSVLTRANLTRGVALLDLVNGGIAATQASSLATANPWGDKAAWMARREAQNELESTVRAMLRGLLDPLRQGTMNTARASALAGRLADTSIVAAAQLGAGTNAITGSTNLAGMLTAQADNIQVRIDALLDKLAAGDATEAQTIGWIAQTLGGGAHAGFVMGGVGDETGQVYRVMAAESDHCVTCPPKARIYANLADCIDRCGGVPGDGSDQCCGNCNCHIEPAEPWNIAGGSGGTAAGWPTAIQVARASLPQMPQISARQRGSR
jgi:hypothetical protein